MGEVNGASLTDLRIISNPQGDIFHGMKSSESSFKSFGEAYFSTIKAGAIKGWKVHRKMILNLVVPVGKVKFVVHDNREDSSTKGSFFEVVLSKDNYKRLTVEPGLWMAFMGLGADENLVLNLASIEHDPEEQENCSLESFSYEW